MPDFRAKYDPTVNNQALIRAMSAKSAGPHPLTVALDAGMGGLEKGLVLSETIGKIKADREKKQRLINMLATPEGEQLDTELGGMAQDLAPEQIMDYKMKKERQTNELDAERGYNAARTKNIEAKTADILEAQRLREKRRTVGLTPSEEKDYQDLMKQSNSGIETLNNMLGNFK